MRRLCARRLSFGTSPERIAPESVTPANSRSVHRNISRWCPIGSTRSSLPQADKRQFGGEILKVRAGCESNQK